MDKLTINQYKSSFDAIAHYIENEQKEQVEIWFARELQAVLGYARWENFIVTINRAVDSCKTQGINVDDHFREVTKMIEIGKGGKRPVEEYMLISRVATDEKNIEQSTKKLPKNNKTDE